MAVIRRKLNEGELSIPEQASMSKEAMSIIWHKPRCDANLSIPKRVSEKIRLMCGWDEENFYSQTGHGCMLEEGFMKGLWLGCKREMKTTGV
jgi:hypothetical protein